MQRTLCSLSSHPKLLLACASALMLTPRHALGQNTAAPAPTSTPQALRPIECEITYCPTGASPYDFRTLIVNATSEDKAFSGKFKFPQVDFQNLSIRCEYYNYSSSGGCIFEVVLLDRKTGRVVTSNSYEFGPKGPTNTLKVGGFTGSCRASIPGSTSGYLKWYCTVK